MTVHDGNDPKRLFIWCKRDKVIPHALEPDKVVCEIRAAVSLMRNWRQTAQCVPDFSNHAVGGAAVFDRNIFPNRFPLLDGNYSRSCTGVRAVSRALVTQAFKDFVAGN